MLNVDWEERLCNNLPFSRMIGRKTLTKSISHDNSVARDSHLSSFAAD